MSVDLNERKKMMSDSKPISEMTPEEQAKLQAESAAHIAGQQAEFAESQVGYDPSKIGDPAEYTPLTEDQIRAAGGYFLMDPQWMPGGPWDGGPDEGKDARPSNRVAAIEEMLKSGTAFAWTDPYLSDPHTVATDGTPVGYFKPDEQGNVLLQSHMGHDDLRSFAIGHGNGIVAGTINPTYTVPGV
jgi:hypothetical protein